MSTTFHERTTTRLRPMRETDLAQIADIERESFTSMWPQTAYKRELDNSVARYFVIAEPLPDEPEEAASTTMWRQVRRRFARASAHGAPAERVLGFVGLWLLAGEAHIVTFAVRESHRRRGVGERLLIAAFDCAFAHDQQSLTLEVRASNDPARSLYEKYGMTAAGIRKRYYTDNNEDAVIMTSQPLGEPGYRARLEALRDRHRTLHPGLWV